MSTIPLNSNRDQNEAIQSYLDTLDLYTSGKNIVFKYKQTKKKFNNPPTFSYNLPNTLEIEGIADNKNINIKITLPLKLKLILKLNKQLEEYRSKIKELNIDNIDNINKEDYDQWKIQLGEIQKQLNHLELEKQKSNRTQDLNRKIILNDMVRSKLNDIRDPNYLWNNYKLFNPYKNLKLTIRPGVFNDSEGNFSFNIEDEVIRRRLENEEIELEQKEEEFTNYFIEGDNVPGINSQIEISEIQTGGRKPQSINKNKLQKTVNSRLPEGWKAYYVPEKDSMKHAVLLHLNLFTDFSSNKVFAQSILSRKDKYEDFYDVSSYSDEDIKQFRENNNINLLELPEYNYTLLIYHEDYEGDVVPHKNQYRRIIYNDNPVFLDETDKVVYDEEHNEIGKYKYRNRKYIIIENE